MEAENFFSEHQMLKKRLLENELRKDVYFLEAKESKIKMRDCYRIDKLLGKGAYGEVRQCVYKENIKDKKSTVKDYRAVKI